MNLKLSYRRHAAMDRIREELPFFVLIGIVCVGVLLGGSSRSDVPMLLVLRPLALVGLALGMLTLKQEYWKHYRVLLMLAGGIVLIPALQLVPLPPEVWQALPGRGLISEIDRAAGLGQPWRPVSMTPFETRNALFSLSVPLAVIVLGVQLSQARLRQLTMVLLALGVLSAFWGLLQILAASNSALYLYRITNNGSAVGLFANRNHQAFLLACLFPLLAYVAISQDGAVRFRWLLAALAGLILIPLIFITGSRSGLILATIAVLSLPFIAIAKGERLSPGSPNAKLSSWRGSALLASGLGLILLTALMDRALAWKRFGTDPALDDMRVRILPTLWDMVRTYLPLGSGMGSFERVYQVHEPDELLAPFYMNHAHNDWLELLLTGGIPAAVLLLIVLVLFVRQARGAFWSRAQDPDSALVRMGLVLILLAGAASLTDYPLRTPAGMTLLALAGLWSASSSSGEKLVRPEHSG